MINDSTIREFIRRRLLGVSPQCVGFRLTAQSDGVQLVQTGYPTGDIERAVSALWEEMHSLANAHALVEPGRYKYKLEAIAAGADAKPIGAMVFTVDTTAEAMEPYAKGQAITLATSGPPSVQPLPPQIVKMALDHSAALTGTVLQTFLGVSRMQSEMLDRQSRHIAALEARQIEQFEMLRKLSLANTERKIMKLEAAGAQARKDRFVDQLVELAPTLLESVTGEGPAFELLSSLSAEQFGMLATGLNEKQKGIIDKLLKRKVERDKKAEARKEERKTRTQSAKKTPTIAAVVELVPKPTKGPKDAAKG